MTAPRIARASRSRFFIGLGIFVLTMGFVAIFHSAQQQLDEMRHLELRCQQQQEQLTAQLEAKEKAASADRLEQQQFKRNLERKAREQTELKEKTVMDTNQKLSSLQQHYKLLKSQNDDLTEECTKTKAKQLADIKLLQDKIKTLQSQHQKDVDSAKRQNEQMATKDAEIERLRKEITGFTMHCSWRPESVASEHVAHAQAHTSKKSNDKNFNAQILLVPKPLIGINLRSSTTTTTPTSRRKTSEATNDKLNEAPIAPMPDQAPRTSSTTVANRKTNGTVPRARQSKPVPDGVVPIQSSFDELMIRNLDQKAETPNENNRYVNVVDEAVDDANNKKKLDNDSIKKKLNEPQNDNDNGAREVNDDNNDFVVHDAHKGGDGIKNAAEEDMNLYENKFNLARPIDTDAHFHRAVDDLTIQRGAGVGGNDDEDAKALNHDNNKLLNEIDGDQGKVVYPDVLHIEEQLEDEDDDEYANPGARKQEPAVRI